MCVWKIEYLLEKVGRTAVSALSPFFGVVCRQPPARGGGDAQNGTRGAETQILDEVCPSQRGLLSAGRYEPARELREGYQADLVVVVVVVVVVV